MYENWREKMLQKEKFTAKEAVAVVVLLKLFKVLLNFLGAFKFINALRKKNIILVFLLLVFFCYALRNFVNITLHFVGYPEKALFTKHHSQNCYNCKKTKGKRCRLGWNEIFISR